MHTVPKFLLLFGLTISGVLLACGANSGGGQPVEAAEIVGSASTWTGDSNRAPGPAVSVLAIDGKRVLARSPETPHHVQPGWHKFKLAIIRVDIDATPTFEIPVQANRKYKFVTAPAGYEYRVWFFDITDKTPGLLFEAVVTRSKTPTITWVRPPRVSKPPEKNDSK